jgi:hypothetical protein
MKMIVTITLGFFVVFSASTSMGKALNAKDLTNAGIQSLFTDAQAAAAIKDGVTKRRYDQDDRVRRQAERRGDQRPRSLRPHPQETVPLKSG